MIIYLSIAPFFTLFPFLLFAQFPSSRAPPLTSAVEQFTVKSLGSPTDRLTDCLLCSSWLPRRLLREFQCGSVAPPWALPSSTFMAPSALPVSPGPSTNAPLLVLAQERSRTSKVRITRHLSNTSHMSSHGTSCKVRMQHKLDAFGA